MNKKDRPIATAVVMRARVAAEHESFSQS